MLFSVTKNKVVLSEEEKVNEGEYKATSCQFEFDDVYTGLVIKAVFTNSSRGSYEVPILDDRCDIPAEVLQSKGSIKVGVYGYEVDGNELVLRYSPSPTFVKVDSGSYVSNPLNPEEITPTQFEQYMQAMNDGLAEVENVNIDATKEGHTATVTITNRDGQTKSVEILDGSKGEKGDMGDTGPRGATGPANTLSIGTVQGGDTAAATITGTSPNQTLNLTLPKGDKGDKGDTGPRGHTNVSAGNAIQIDTEDNNKISADIYPDDFFTATDEVSGKGTTITLNNTIALELDSVEICGDINQNGTPTPDTPVNINVVTGEQMITVSDGESQSQSYTVDLGSIELCKIGDYQDYIYKGADGWYVHKDIGKINVTSTEISAFNTHNGTHITVNYSDTSVERLSTPAVTNVSDRFVGSTNTQVWSGSVINGVAQPTNGNYLQFSLPISVATTQAEVRTYFDNHPTIVYYTLATPTDTKITDTALVGQLEALAKAQAYDGQTNIGVTASGTNLSAILSVNGYRKSLAGMTKAINYLMSKAE